MESENILGRRYKDDVRRAKVSRHEVWRIVKKVVSQGTQFIYETHSGVLFPSGQQ